MVSLHFSSWSLSIYLSRSLYIFVVGHILSLCIYMSTVYISYLSCFCTGISCYQNFYISFNLCLLSFGLWLSIFLWLYCFIVPALFQTHSLQYCSSPVSWPLSLSPAQIQSSLFTIIVVPYWFSGSVVVVPYWSYIGSDKHTERSRNSQCI